MTGKSLIKQSLKKSTQNMVESIDLAELTKGIYFLKLSKGKILVVKRLVKG
nr:T9SS type A sorting domain-containing protein [Flexithrix dorotheae]